MSRRPARCTQADIQRAIKAAAASEKPMAVEVLPDGTIRITPIPPQGSSTVPGEPKREVVL